MSKVLTAAKDYLEKMAAHDHCCGTVQMRALVAEYEKALLAIANLSVASPHYSDGKFEAHASAMARMKSYARDCLAELS